MATKHHERSRPTSDEALASDLLTMDDAAALLGYADRSGSRRWLRKNDVRIYRRGKRLLVKRSAIDAALEKHAEGDRAARAKEAMMRRSR